MESALKAQVIEAVEEMYLVVLRNRYTAYLGVSVRDLLDHLLLRYGRISARDWEQERQQDKYTLGPTCRGFEVTRTYV